jgi:ParB-like chromosome segregation protein Spo0J
MPNPGSLSTTVWPIAALRPHERNPRTIEPEELDRLVESLRQYQCVEPVVVNTREGRRGVILGGHQRVEAMRRLGWEVVPVVTVDLGAQEELALLIALNRIKGTWDLGKLRAMVEAIPSIELDAIGFTAEALPQLLDGPCAVRGQAVELLEPVLGTTQVCPTCGYRW